MEKEVPVKINIPACARSWFSQHVVPEGTSFPSLSIGVVAIESLFDTIRSGVVDILCHLPSLAAKPLTIHRFSIHLYGAFMILGRKRANLGILFAEGRREVGYSFTEKQEYS